MLRIREATVEDAPAIACIHVLAWQRDYVGIAPAAYLHALSIEGHSDFWRSVIDHPQQAQLLLVAEYTRRTPVGFLSAGAEHDNNPLYPGEIYALYVHPTARRQGIGRSLFSAARTQLAALGKDPVLLWTVHNGPACAFYHALGGTFLYTTASTLGGEPITLAAYGWPALVPAKTNMAAPQQTRRRSKNGQRSL